MAPPRGGADLEGQVSAGSAGSRPLYSPADNLGNFSPLLDDETSRANEFAETFDLDEVELDPSERRPGGPVAEAVLAFSDSVKAKKWAVPLVGFLAASFFQSIGSYSATGRYVLWMDDLVEDLGRNSTDGKGESLVDAFKLQDPFRDLFANPVDVSPVIWLSYLTPIMPVLWAVNVVQSRNLRLWTRTLLVATILALLKAVIAWMTVVPHPAGWGNCRMHLNQGLLHQTPGNFFTALLGTIAAFFDVVWLFLCNIFNGNHGPDSLVCSDAVVSGPTYFSSLFALALYDAMRVETRKMKPHFRWLYRLLFGFVLTALVIQAAHMDLIMQRQYGADVVLALVFTLLLYSCPAVAICADRWLTLGSSSTAFLADSKDPYDKGDVVVPLCCFPFCCWHGRYFIYTTAIKEVQKELENQQVREQRLAAEMRQQAATAAEEFRISQEESATRLLEVEALIQSEHQRAEARKEQEREEGEQNCKKAVAGLQAAFKVRLASGIADLEKQMKQEQQAAAQAELDEASRILEVEVQSDETLRAMAVKVAASANAVAERRVEMRRLQAQEVQERAELKELEELDAERQELETKDDASVKRQVCEVLATAAERGQLASELGSAMARQEAPRAGQLQLNYAGGKLNLAYQAP